MNIWNGIGRLTKEVEIRETTNSKVANFTLAIDNPFGKDDNTKTFFINCVAFGKTAEFFDKYLNTKGLRIAVTGSIQTRTWTDKNEAKHFATEILVNNVYFADGKTSNNSKKSSSTDDDEFEL